MASNYLSLSWGTSRGRDTYGYNICRLDDRATNRRFRCMGGGYDMVGTVLGEWLEAEYQDRLAALADDPEKPLMGGGYADSGYFKREDLYGLTFYVGDDTVTAHLNGACGRESIIRIAEAIGVSITDNYNRRKNRTEGFFVSDSRA